MSAMLTPKPAKRTAAAANASTRAPAPHTIGSRTEPRSHGIATRPVTAVITPADPSSRAITTLSRM